MIFGVVLLFIGALLIKILIRKKTTLMGKHVVITGGSSGIGKALAILAAQQGAHVSILARKMKNLIEAQKEIQSYTLSEEQIITKLNADVTNYKDVEHNLYKVEEISGPIFMLVNCAGLAICGEIEEYTEQQIKSLIDVNFLGTLYAIKAMVPKFKLRRHGVFVLTASQTALMGIFGMSVYSACKYALRGLAESLHMEVKPYNITVTLALPPDTNTPGFENENKTKPEETKLISETGGLMDPADVAKKIMDDALEGKFFSFVGFESFLLTTLCVGMSPITSVHELLVQALMLGPLRLASAYYRIYFDRIIRKCFIKKNRQQGIQETE